ncbi:Sb-PDE family phosphodiesterase [Carboxylicivirga marina]|uniref:Polymerase/histidinol phosphatase N-terminal domain-containing protein n=1 Tax=Carboxylicivirga marina TaxID=2800988 RepID=A0ABS1HQW4_9BACT|nr:Sb-PDE family phosphodiesterase [Carboxylicivirga marina]MBK3520010.1 hypothetical protein [Carboxylicivirga marina]
MRDKLFIGLLLVMSSTVWAQVDINHQENEVFVKPQLRKNIRIPNIPGYQTLKGDFHIHTMFSDGQVWPGIRVEEAWREGLDVIAITDHIEYLPHKKHLSADHNTAYKLALKQAVEKNIILIKGTEITKNKVPPGHFNALFIEDANPIENEDVSLSIEEAVRQGAFIIWNHPGWKRQQPDSTKWWDFYTELISKNRLHGIEVANANEWYPIALDWCTEKKLTVFGNSDIHAPINLKYDLSERYAHRPMTLVFAKERTKQSVKEALFAGNTIAWFGNTLAGKEELMQALLKNALILQPAFRQVEKKGVEWYYAELSNVSDIPFVLQANDRQDQKMILEPQSSVIVSYRADEKDLTYRVNNAFVGSTKNMTIVFDL